MSIANSSPESIARGIAVRKRSGTYYHSDKTKQKLSIALLGKNVGKRRTEEARQRNREAYLGEKNWFFGKTHTESSKEKISRSVSRAFAEGRLVPSISFPFKNSVGFHNGVKMKCLNSEGVFADQLDKADILWVYESKWFRTSRGSYLPDFFLPEFNIWVEVKGYPEQIDRRTFAKYQAFREELGKCLIVIYQHELERLVY